jgi:tRNA1(Val) A37 N6-methylase TrmN6
MERNPDIPFTYEYSQPEEYHFSIDSVEMPWEVAQSLKQRVADGEISSEQMRSWKVLDLCAGCGVLGFELNFHLQEIRHIDFVEIQEDYVSHFEYNKNLALKKSVSPPKGLRLVRDEASQAPEFHFHLINYDQWPQASGGKKYDLILCNPPYFLPEQGKLSPSQFKNRCRFFIDSSFKNLIDVIHESLDSQGEAYLLLRDLEDHGIDLLTEIRHLTRGLMKIENLTMIRGTFLLKLYR